MYYIVQRRCWSLVDGVQCCRAPLLHNASRVQYISSHSIVLEQINDGYAVYLGLRAVVLVTLIIMSTCTYHYPPEYESVLLLVNTLQHTIFAEYLRHPRQVKTDTKI